MLISATSTASIVPVQDYGEDGATGGRSWSCMDDVDKSPIRKVCQNTFHWLDAQYIVCSSMFVFLLHCYKGG